MTSRRARLVLGVPPEARAEDGSLLGPERIELSTLIEPADILRFVDSIAGLTRMECSALLYDPERPRPITAEAPICAARSPICRLLSGVKRGGFCQCVWDAHAAAHAAMRSGEPARGDCLGGDGLLYACPVSLYHGGEAFPKVGICAAAFDVFNLHYPDRLARIAGRTVKEMQDLMCETDKHSLNAEQLRLIRSVMRSQAESFSRQISERYAEMESTAVIASQRDELDRAYTELDTECRRVGQLQRGLVPQDLPPIPAVRIATHYVTARQAGGDYYDFLPHADGSWGLVVADVSGHGPPAAVIMAMLRALLHARPSGLDQPKDVLAYANRNLATGTLAEHFTTAFYGALGPDGRLLYASSGHPPPLHYRAATGEVRPLSTGEGLPLGIERNTAYEQEETLLAPADALVLYTDGVTEAFSPADEVFGLQRLARLVAETGGNGARAMCDTVVSELRRFTSSPVSFDDQTIVVVERA